MSKFAGVVVAAAAKDEVVTAVIAIAVCDDGVAFGEATVVLDGRQAGVVGFFEGAAECFLEDGVPRFTLGVFGCGRDLLTTAFDRGGEGWSGGVCAERLLGSTGMSCWGSPAVVTMWTLEAQIWLYITRGGSLAEKELKLKPFKW